MGAQGLRCLNRCPSLLPGLAVAKTRTHHRNGTGCWGRETSKAQEEERPRRKRGERREKRKEKAKTKRQHCMVESHLERPERTKGKRRLTQPSLSAPFSLWSKQEMRNTSLLW